MCDQFCRNAVTREDRLHSTDDTRRRDDREINNVNKLGIVINYEKKITRIHVKKVSATRCHGRVGTGEGKSGTASWKRLTAHFPQAWTKCWLAISMPGHTTAIAAKHRHLVSTLVSNVQPFEDILMMRFRHQDSVLNCRKPSDKGESEIGRVTAMQLDI